MLEHERSAESGLSLKLAWRRVAGLRKQMPGIGGYAAPPIARIPDCHVRPFEAITIV